MTPQSYTARILLILTKCGKTHDNGVSYNSVQLLVKIISIGNYLDAWVSTERDVVRSYLVVGKMTQDRPHSRGSGVANVGINIAHAKTCFITVHYSIEQGSRADDRDLDETLEGMGQNWMYAHCQRYNQGASEDETVS